MTLAAILIVTLLTAPGLLRKSDSSLGMAFVARLENSASAQDAATTTAKKQDQAPATSTQSPPNSSKPAPSASHSSQTSSGQTPAAPAKRPLRKKPKAVDCDTPSAPTTVEQTAASTGLKSTPATGSAKAPAPQSRSTPGNSSASAASTPDNCPPTRKIVRQGGSSEPSVQLVGGKGGQQSSADKDTANQLLGTTEENLKKIGGQQLTSSQQDMVDQIRQFMSQSKTAQATGDMERARALASKAQLLSQELVKPQQ
jgi:hypothetical protein